MDKTTASDSKTIGNEDLRLPAFILTAIIFNIVTVVFAILTPIFSGSLSFFSVGEYIGMLIVGPWPFLILFPFNIILVLVFTASSLKMEEYLENNAEFDESEL